MGLDAQLFLMVQELTGNALLDSSMVFLSEYLAFLVPLTLSYLWFLDRKGKEDAVLTGFSVLLGIGFTYFMGLFYFHNQPFTSFDTLVSGVPDNAFPSQHTAGMFSAFWPLIYRERKKLAMLIGAAAVLTGFGRVYVGLHYPLDILGATVSSVVGFGLVYGLEDRFEELTGKVADIEQRLREELFSRF